MSRIRTILDVISISSAEGWWAVNLENGEMSRLACFAIVSDSGHRRVIGLDSLLDPDFAPEASGEDTYVWLGNEPTAEQIQAALDRLRAER